VLFTLTRKRRTPCGKLRRALVCTVQALINSDRAGNFAGTQAPGTNIYMARRAVDHCLHALDIGLPGAIGTPMRVRDLDAKAHALVAKFALSHPLHLLAVITYGSLAPQAVDIITDNVMNCKHYLTKKRNFFGRGKCCVTKGYKI
jgi:hypothetical protein